MAIQYVILVVWVVAIAMSFQLGADLVAVIAAIAISSFVIWFFVNPRRPWWGPGPRSVLADRVAFRRYQIRMTVAMIVVLLIATPMTAIILKAVGAQSP
jgi:hypothetical protein